MGLAPGAVHTATDRDGLAAPREAVHVHTNAHMCDMVQTGQWASRPRASRRAKSHRGGSGALEEDASRHRRHTANSK